MGSVKLLERELKAVANRRRLAILQYLKKRRQASVGDIADAIKLSFRSTSKHLAVLATADIIEKEQRSSQVFYRVGDDQSVTLQHLLDLL